MENRTFTMLRQRTLFSARIFVSDHILLTFLTSFIINLLQPSFGGPTDRLPYGFQFRVILVIFRWDSKYFLNSPPLSNSLVSLNRAISVVLFGKKICNISHKELFYYVSQSYNKIDLTFVLKNLF